MGFNPQIYYGLCGIKNEFEFYHMWIELDEKIIDLAIYGNAKFNFFRIVYDEMLVFFL